MQKLGHVNVDALDHGRNLGQPGSQGVQHLLLAQLSVGDILVQLFVRLADGRTVGRIDDRQIQLEEFAQRGQILDQAAALFRDHGRARSEDQIAGKQGFFFFQVVTQMISRMARSMDRAQGGPVGFNPGPVLNIGERKVVDLVFARPGFLGHPQLAELGLYVGRAADVVLMHMGDDDFLQFGGAVLGLGQTLLEQGVIHVKPDTGVQQNRFLALADQVGVGAGTGERAGVLGPGRSRPNRSRYRNRALSARPWCRSQYGSVLPCVYLPNMFLAIVWSWILDVPS